MFYRFLTLFAFSAALASAQTYTQYNMYDLTSCSGQPTYMISSQSGQCQIQGTPASQCTAVSGPNSVYQSQKLTCSPASLNLEGIVQWFVATSTWTTSSTCEGNPIQVEAMVADALCHPAQSKDGVITSFFSVNCNGGRPLYKTCKDAGCTDCTEVQSTGQCDIMGAGTSRQVACVKPGSKNLKGIYDFEGDESSAAKMSVSTGLGLFFAAAAFQN